MMSKEKRRVPKLRFPGFTEDWEQRKLGEYANFRRGSFPQPYGNKEWYDGVGSAPFVQVVDVGDNLSLVECTKQRISKLAQPMSVYAEKGSVLVTLQGSIGRVAVSQYDAFIDRTILIFQGYKYKTNSYFWAYIIKNKFFEEALKAPGGTIKTITKEVLSNFIILYPKFSEQEQIGSFFEKLDKLITLHQRKLDNLKLKKKALLQKLFPKNGERYPELRFPGFTDAWEQRKLGNIVDFLDGQRKPLKESERTKGKYPYYGASGIIDYINDYLFDENLVLLSEDGANIIDRNYPVCFIATGKYWVNNHAHVLKVKTGVIDKFICESLERLDYTKFNTGTAQPKLNQDICQKIVITIPNEDEQKCISEFLDRINNIITLHQ